MYANYNNQNFNSDKIYTFIRKKDKDIIFVAVNFSDQELNTEIIIPEHAFEYLEIEEGKYDSKDLLSNEKNIFELKRNGTINTMIKANGAIMLKFTKQKVVTKRKK